MPFFAPLPQPQPEADQPNPVFFSFPWQEPEHRLPGLGPAGTVLARNATTALYLSVTGVYRTVLALAVRGRFHPDHVDEQWPPRRHQGPMDDLRFGLQWADGSRAEVEESWPEPGGTAGDSGFRLAFRHGSAGGLGQDWGLWLWPLPAPAAVTVHVLWERRGIPETATEFDLSTIVGWAAQSVELWPLPAAPDDGAWVAYSPLSARATASGAVRADEPEADGT